MAMLGFTSANFTRSILVRWSIPCRDLTAE
jgi:hypothetical protein